MPRRRAFIDTNVLVYAFDDSDPAKKRSAIRVLEGAFDGSHSLSTQVLQEFYSVTTRKIDRPLEEVEAARAVRMLACLPVVQVDARMVLAAIETSRTEKLSIWDALVVQAALEGGCTVLLSEDFQQGRVYGALLVENPFREPGSDSVHDEPSAAPYLGSPGRRRRPPRAD